MLLSNQADHELSTAGSIFICGITKLAFGIENIAFTSIFDDVIISFSLNRQSAMYRYGNTLKNCCCTKDLVISM